MLLSFLRMRKNYIIMTFDMIFTFLQQLCWWGSRTLFVRSWICIECFDFCGRSVAGYCCDCTCINLGYWSYWSGEEASNIRGETWRLWKLLKSRLNCISAIQPQAVLRHLELLHSHYLTDETFYEHFSWCEYGFLQISIQEGLEQDWRSRIVIAYCATWSYASHCLFYNFLWRWK